MTETVYVNRGPGREQVYHTDETCGYLGENPQTWIRDTADAWDYQHCKWCSGEYDWSRVGGVGAHWGESLR